MFIDWMEPNVSGTSDPWRDPEEYFTTLLPWGKSMPLRSRLLLIHSRWEKSWIERPTGFKVACCLIIHPQKARDTHAKAWHILWQAQQQILWGEHGPVRLSVMMECSGSLLLSVQTLAMCGCSPFKRWPEQWKDWLFIWYQNVQFPKHMWLSLSAVNRLVMRPSEELSRRGSFFPPYFLQRNDVFFHPSISPPFSSWQVKEGVVRGSPVKSPEPHASLSVHAV